MVKRKFKTGDRVRVISSDEKDQLLLDNPIFYGGLDPKRWSYLGKVGTIKEVKQNDGMYNPDYRPYYVVEGIPVIEPTSRFGLDWPEALLVLIDTDRQLEMEF